MCGYIRKKFSRRWDGERVAGVGREAHWINGGERRAEAYEAALGARSYREDAVRSWGLAIEEMEGHPL